jgi:hypothetical protein
MLFVCLVAGMALRLGDRVPPNAHLAINGFIINIALPALVLAQIHDMQPDPALIWPVLMPWIVFAGSTITFYCLGRAMRLADTNRGRDFIGQWRCLLPVRARLSARNVWHFAFKEYSAFRNKSKKQCDCCDKNTQTA